jgi:hypothetical protein
MSSSNDILDVGFIAGFKWLTVLTPTSANGPWENVVGHVVLLCYLITWEFHSMYPGPNGCDKNGRKVQQQVMNGI